MKPLKIFFIAVAAIFASTSFSLRAQVKITDGSVYTMDPNSLLDLTSTNKGLLIPRMAINDLNLPAPLTSPVPVGMQVYSTGGAVQDGFYYWHPSFRWVRFKGEGDPVNNSNTVTKSANDTLLKTENMVFATGNIVLTFPAVTAADDGLEFTVKNTGIYSDLVSLVGYAGALIDNNVTVTLSRWKARTFIAKGGNWFFKEREVMKDNYLDVGAFSSFNTIAGVVAFMNLHMDGPTVVQLGPGTFTIDATQVIDLPYPVVFVGSSYGATRIVGAAGVSGTPLFDCKTECYFKMLDFTAYSNASGNNGLNLTGSGVYHEIKDCAFTGFNKGIVSTTNHSLIWVFEVAFVNCTGAGIEIADGSAIGGYLKMSECTFAQCKIGINLLSGVNETVSLNSAVFTNTVSGTDIGIQYIPATFTSITSMYISGNSWNNEGTYMSGFDFERTDGRDANVFLMNNVGMENENPHFKITLLNNTTTVAADGTTWVKANWTDTSPILTVYTCKWDLSTIVNRFRYLSRNKADVIMWISGNVASTSGSNRTISMAICKNGVTTARYGETTLRTVTQNYPYQFSTVVYLSDTGPGDYFELFFNSTNGITDRIVISDLNWYSDAH